MIYKLINVVGYAESLVWDQNGIDHFGLDNSSDWLRVPINCASPTLKILLLKSLTDPSSLTC